MQPEPPVRICSSFWVLSLSQLSYRLENRCRPVSLSVDYCPQLNSVNPKSVCCFYVVQTLDRFFCWSHRFLTQYKGVYERDLKCQVKMSHNSGSVGHGPPSPAKDEVNTGLG